MADVIYTVGPSKTFATIAAALAQILTDEGASPFTNQRIVDIFDDTYDETVQPSTSLDPTATNRLIIRGATGNFPLIERTVNSSVFIIDDIDNYTIRNVEVQRVDGGNSAMVILGASPNGIIEGCTIHGSLSTDDVLLLNIVGTSDDMIIFDNTFFNTTSANHAFRILTNDYLIYNNQFFAVDRAFQAPDASDGGEFYFNSALGTVVGDGFLFTSTTNGAKIKNNISSNFVTGFNIRNGITGLDSDHNCVFGNTNAFRDFATSTDYATLALWQAATIHDDNSIDDDPEFVNTTSGSEDLHLKNGSPCVAAGVTIPSNLDNTVVNTITVGTGPRGLAITPDGTEVYVANLGANTVSVIRVSDGVVTDTITVGSLPIELAITPDGTEVYVTNSLATTVSVISTSSKSVTNTITVGTFPVGVAVTPDGSEVYVANQSSGTVSVIETSGHTVTDTITVGTTPQGIAVTPDGTEAYVANFGDNTVKAISTSSKTVTNTITVGTGPFGVTATPDDAEIYFGDRNRRTHRHRYHNSRCESPRSYSNT